MSAFIVLFSIQSEPIREYFHSWWADTLSSPMGLLQTYKRRASKICEDLRGLGQEIPFIKTDDYKVPDDAECFIVSFGQKQVHLNVSALFPLNPIAVDKLMTERLADEIKAFGFADLND